MYIFKPGDRAYWMGFGWIKLVENTEKYSSPYLLRDKASSETFTADGRRYARGGDIVLLPLNPYDPTDPLNPPEFRWPFFLNGRPVGIGDELILKQSQESLWVTSLIYGKDNTRVCGNPSFGYFVLIPENFYWPDELPVKKKVADWVYTYTRYWGEVWVEFAKGLTEEEVNRLHGASGVTIKMIPGTEREVEGCHPQTFLALFQNEFVSYTHRSSI